jgi:hypothetical protein
VLKDLGYVDGEFEMGKVVEGMEELRGWRKRAEVEVDVYHVIHT